MTDPRTAQRQAADPGASIFVTANAGSGKTTTLVDRVARLLLDGAEPEAVLCVTYTKAAAAEMQRRLFQRLGDWSVMEDQPLRERLGELQDRAVEDFSPRELSEARALFARALEAPGGLKIQTIHAFCEKLLKRFPLEAGVSPGFKVMDDRDAAEIAGEARETMAGWVQTGPSRLADAYARMSVALAFDDFQGMFAAFETRRADIAGYLDRCGGEAAADVWARCGFEAPTSEAEIEAEAMGVIDMAVWRAAADVLSASGGKADTASAEKLKIAASSSLFTDALVALFTDGGEGTPATWVAKSSGLRAREDLRARLLDDQDHLERARERRCAARIGEDTVHALILAQAYVQAYATAKRARGALDFADLILKTCELLTERADAAWVLYKLDGGIDHILVDEAQDTAPEQWAILKALTSEFFAGEGAGLWRVDLGRVPLERTLFVVGDEKQSIYSFQGADPDRLRSESAAYHAQIQAVGRRSAHVPLIASFRSTPEVLGFVDAVFADRDAWAGVPAPSGDVVLRHLAMRQGDPGCVDLWPLEREEPGEERGAWDEPLDIEGRRSANRVLAEKIATEIEALIARGDQVFDKDTRTWRGANAGDVLILVRRRRALFEEILRALKRRGVPVAGADRLSLSTHVAFDDLMALARFIQFEDDDLTLAALLKAPFIGLGEAELFTLAHGRKGGLWRALQARAGEDPAWAEAAQFLQRCRTEGRARRPFDFFSRLLGWTDGQGRSVRARILTRLGSEAEDVLHEFLAQVLTAERAGIADLERLIQAFADLDITVKREMEGARGEVRVMTVHGAKGLEAPIVFLPETTVKRGARGSPLLKTEDGGFLWAPTKKADCDASRAARDARELREEHEAQRLFYVALTRARDRLVLSGRIAANARREDPKDWYAAAEEAFGAEALAPQVRELDGGVRRFGPDPLRGEVHSGAEAGLVGLPPWFAARPAPESPVRFASPSRLGDEEPDVGPAPSPLAETQGLGRYRRGDLIHRLLQLLPDIAPAERGAAAARMLARERDLTEAQRGEMAAAALGVLNDAQFAAVFGPGSRAEVAVAGLAPRVGPISGRVDRLVVEANRVLVIDFKTNRPAPARIEDADPAYIKQMAVYVAVLRTIFPDRAVEAALVWTDGPRLMPVPENLTARALSGLADPVDT